MSTALVANFDVSVSKRKGQEESGIVRTNSEVNQDLSVSNTFCSDGPQENSWCFLVRLMRGQASSE